MAKYHIDIAILHACIAIYGPVRRAVWLCRKIATFIEGRHAAARFLTKLADPVGRIAPIRLAPSLRKRMIESFELAQPLAGAATYAIEAQNVADEYGNDIISKEPRRMLPSTKRRERMCAANSNHRVAVPKRQHPNTEAHVTMIRVDELLPSHGILVLYRNVQRRNIFSRLQSRA